MFVLENVFYFSKKVRLFSQNDVLFLFYFLINPAGTTVSKASGVILPSQGRSFAEDTISCGLHRILYANNHITGTAFIS